MILFLKRIFIHTILEFEAKIMNPDSFYECQTIAQNAKNSKTHETLKKLLFEFRINFIRKKSKFNIGLKDNKLDSFF